MQDRLPLYPGRVTLTPVEGQANTYDMVRADSPTQEGTPLNKANLLTDETAALYGLGADAVPNDALSMLGPFVSGLGNEYLWKVVGNTWVALKSDTEKEITAAQTGDANRPYIRYSSTINIGAAGELSLGGSVKTIRPSYSAPQVGLLVGKYIQYSLVSYDYSATQDIYYIESYSYESGYAYFVHGRLVTTDLVENYTSYVNAHDPNAYPPAEDDGYTYTYIGQVGNSCRIETGSYVGTGVDGYQDDGCCSITFSQRPRIVWIYGLKNPSNGYYYPNVNTYSQNNYISTLCCEQLTSEWIDTVLLGSLMSASDGMGYKQYGAKIVGSTLYWYSRASGRDQKGNWQFNQANYTYYWLAIM